MSDVTVSPLTRSPHAGSRRSPRRSPRSAPAVTSPMAPPVTAGQIFDDASKGARDINDLFFTIPEGHLAKRYAVFDQQWDDGAPEAGSRRQGTSHDPSPTDSDALLGPPSGRQGAGTPTPQKPDLGAVLSDDRLREPTPLNCTLGHSMSVDEFLAQHKRGVDQEQRLARLQRGQAPTMHQRESEPLVIALVGLPACGKTYVARRILRYLTWMGVRCKVFNAGIYRRKMLGFQNAAFFDPLREEHLKRRGDVASTVLEDLADYIRNDGGQVAIYDATSSTRARRTCVRQCLLGGAEPLLQPGRLIFLEITCSEPQRREELIRDAARTMPDYQDAARWTHDRALEDLRARVAHYARNYEPVSNDEDVSYMQMDHSTERMKMHRIKGYLPGRLAFLLMNLRIKQRHIFVCQTAQLSERVIEAAAEAPLSESFAGSAPVVDNPLSRERSSSEIALCKSAHIRKQLAARPTLATAASAAGGTSFLSPEGEHFARGLVGLVRDRVPQGEEVTVWTSSDDAGTSTAAYLAQAGFNVVSWRYLGPFGFSVSQKFMGETYEDVTERLEPIVFEMERSPTHLLIIASHRVAQLLSAYLGERSTPEAMPGHTVVRVVPSAFGFSSELYTMHVSPDEAGEAAAAAAAEAPDAAPVAFTAEPLWASSPTSATSGGPPTSNPTSKAAGPPSPVEIET
eukprot:TRINITY_DN148_c0_g1_i2.p1 TRINITY_DN148_c0_g1~~TRINITY_DN148_c0_g1_i2.p1  ORF type:complete len:751 (+),score=251.59 TRINITY_DN148_c0_g1_i2:206-2254(+)